MDATDRGPDPLPEIRQVELSDIGVVLRRGLRDFLRAPLYGIFFSAVYVAGGLILWKVYGVAGQQWWLAPVAVGFPLLGPFAAVGLYELSRRREMGRDTFWTHAFDVRHSPSLPFTIWKNASWTPNVIGHSPRPILR